MPTRLLMISHTFPPYLHSVGGVIRFVKFIKYITRHRPDWQIDVVTAGFCGTEMAQPVAGKYLLEDIPDTVRVFRIDDPYYCQDAETMQRLQLSSRIKQNIKVWALSSPTIFKWLRRASQKGELLLSNIYSGARANLKVVSTEGKTRVYPDEHISWHEPVLKWFDEQGSRIYDLVFATIPFISTALLGMEIKKRSGIPLILDVRDDWANYWRPGSERERIERRMEQDSVHAANLLVVCTPELEASYRSRYPDLKNIVMISNGVDLEDYTDLWRSPLPENFVITCVGNMKSRSPEIFFQALRRLVDDPDVDASCVQANFPQNMDPAWWQAGFEQGLGANLHGVPELELEEYRCLLENSSLLLIVQTRGRPEAIAAKTFEYWASGRPILLIDEPSAGTRLVENEKLGLTALPDDIDGIYRSLRILYLEHRMGKVPRQPSKNFFQYDREILALRLIENLTSFSYNNETSCKLN